MPVAGTDAAAEVGTSPVTQASDGPADVTPGAPEILGDHTRLRGRVQPPGARSPRPAWGGQALGAVTLALVLLRIPGVAAAETTPAPAPLRAASDLDGLYLWVGPTGAATRIEGGWDSIFGGGVQVLRVREGAWLGAVGAWIGGGHYAERDGGRVWVEGVVGTRRLLGQMIGVSVGPVVELGDLRHPRVGVQGSIWCFAGVVPYAKAGVLEASGSYVELGLSLSLPALRF